MRRTSFEDVNCSVARSLEVIGEWWTLLIVRDALMGVTRFEQFQERLGIARNVLTARLDKLVEEGVLERRAYDEARGRYDYVLTPKGRALWTVVTAIREWGDEWILGKGHEPVAMVHEACGARTTVEPRCSRCHEPLHPGDLHLVPGPGSTDPTLIP